MWDIYPVEKEEKKKAHQKVTKKKIGGKSVWQKLFTPQNQPKTQKREQKNTNIFFRKAAATPKTKHISFWMIFGAFLVALAIVLGYFFRDKLKFIPIKEIRFQPLVLSQEPAQVEIEPTNKKVPLVYYLTQKQEKVSLKSFDYKDAKTIFSFNTKDIINQNSASLEKNYLAYIDNEGLKLYSFSDKQSDFILASTNIARITQVELSPNEQYMAFEVTKNNQSKLYLYSMKERKILEKSFVATNFSFGTKDNIYFYLNESLSVYNLSSKKEEKITDFAKEILGITKQNNTVFIITGAENSITLWKINEKQKTTENLSNFQLTFNFNLEDFGLAQKENILYLSFAGEIIALNLETKTKKEHTFNTQIYRLLNYLSEKDYFVGLKKTSALTELSLVIFSEKEIIFESPIEEKIVFVK